MVHLLSARPHCQEQGEKSKALALGTNFKGAGKLSVIKINILMQLFK